MLGLHAESDWTCRSYTFMLLDEYHFQWNFLEDGLDYVVALSCVVLTLFAVVVSLPAVSRQRKKSDAEKAELCVRAELEQFIASARKRFHLSILIFQGSRSCICQTPRS